MALNARCLRVLTFTSLFPSSARPRHGLFVETRLRQLLLEGCVEVRVIAPIPWFPFKSAVFGSYAQYARTPHQTTRDGGLPVSYPRYPMLPKVGVGFQASSMARAGTAAATVLLRSGWRPDVIDAHYLYPDGVAAAMLAERLCLPLVITARGTDANVLARVRSLAPRIRWAARQAAAVIAVSTRLKQTLVELGVDASKVLVLRNGVDTQRFRPEDRRAARARVGLADGRWVLCVGNLVPEKGFELAVDALLEMPGFGLVIVGEGPLRRALGAQVRRHGLERRVVFLGSVQQEELRWVYSSADVLILSSAREGWPNVVLEALACGTPVVALDVGAVDEMLTCAEVGRIVPARNATALAAAALAVCERPPRRELIVQHAARFDWTTVSRGQLDTFARVTGITAGRCVSASMSAARVT